MSCDALYEWGPADPVAGHSVLHTSGLQPVSATSELTLGERRAGRPPDCSSASAALMLMTGPGVTAAAAGAGRDRALPGPCCPEVRGSHQAFEHGGVPSTTCKDNQVMSPNMQHCEYMAPSSHPGSTLPAARQRRRELPAAAHV